MNNLIEKLENITIKEDLFKDVTYFVTGELQAKVVQLLEKGGASTAKYMVSHVTHLICGKNCSEDVINEAADLYEFPVVNENWVLASALLGRHSTLKPYYPITNKIFSKFTATIVNVSLKDRKTLHALITYNGGIVRKNFDGSINLLICGSAKGPIYAKALQLKNGLRIVTPDWVTNSLKCKSLLAAANYHPRLVIVPKTNPQNIVRQMSDTNSSSLKSIIGFESNESDVSNPQKQQIAQQQQLQSASQMVTQTSVKITQSPQSKIVQLGVNQQQQQPQIFQRSQSQPQFHQINQQNKIILQQQNIQVQKADHMQAINPNLMHHTNIQMQRQQSQPAQQQHESAGGENNTVQQQQQQQQQVPQNQLIIQQSPTSSTIIVNQQQIHQLNQQQNTNQTGQSNQQQQQQQQQQMMTTQKFIVATSTQSGVTTGGVGPSGVVSGGNGQQNQIIQNNMLSQQQKQHILQNLMLNQQQPNVQGGGGGPNKQVGVGGGGTAVGPTQIQIIQTSKGTINQIPQSQQQQPQQNQQQVKNTMIIHNQQLNVSQAQNVMQQIQQQQQQQPNSNQNIIVHQQQQQLNKSTQQQLQQQQTLQTTMNKQILLNTQQQQPSAVGQTNQPTQQIVVINQNIGTSVATGGGPMQQQISGTQMVVQQQQQQHPQMQQHLIQQGNQTVQQQIIQNQQQHHMTQSPMGGGSHVLQQQQKNVIMQQTTPQQIIQQQPNQQNPGQQQQQANQQQRIQYLHNFQQQQLHQQQQHGPQQVISQQGQQQGQQQNVQISQNNPQISGQIVQQQVVPQNNQQQIIVHQNVQQQHQQSPQSNQQSMNQQPSIMQQQIVQQQQQQPTIMQVNNQQNVQQQMIGGNQQQQPNQQQQQLIPQQMTQQQQAMQQMNYQLAQQQQKILNQQQQQIISQQPNQPSTIQGTTMQSVTVPDGTQTVVGGPQNQQIIQNHQLIQQQTTQIVNQQQQAPNQQGGTIQVIQQQQGGQQMVVPQSPQHIQQQQVSQPNQSNTIPIQNQVNQIVVQSNQIVGGQQIVTGQVQPQQQQIPAGGQNTQHIVTGQAAGQQQQQWTPQSPIHGQQQQQTQQQQQQPGQQPQPGQQFIRATRPAWVAAPPGAQRQVHQVHVDAQTHNHLQSLDPMRRAIYISKIQNKQRSLMFRPQVAYQARPGAPGPNIVGAPRPGQTQHIVIRSQVPPGLIQQQQQVQLLQQQGGRPILVRPGTAPGLSPISQQVVGGPSVVVPGQAPAQFDPNATPQQQQQQLLIQRQQHYQRLQQLQLQRDQAAKAIAQQQQGQALSPRSFNPDGTEIITSPIGQSPNQPTTPVPPSPIAQQQMQPNQQMIVQDAAGQAVQNSMNLKTKTALANMLSNRLNNNGVVVPSAGDPGNPAVVNTEPSAAGTLRLMTQQHNAALNPVARTPQEIAALQQQQNQRRTLGNITNNSAIGQQVVGSGTGSAGGGTGGVGGQMTPGVVGAPIVVPQTPPGSIKGPPFSPGRAPPMQRSQFYGHNPNLKLPMELFLLGCIFFIVEYDESHIKELSDWKELIRKHGGEIETTYCAKVTHVLCRSQRHGVVMQAIRDSKRCVTAYWLSDTIIKKQVIPPWQALHLPTPSTFGAGQKPATRHIVSVTGFEGEERNRIKLMISEAGAKFTDYLSKHNTVLICKKLEGLKYKYAKENNMPVVNSSWLSDILLGNLSTMAQYEVAKYQQYNLPGPFRIDYTLVPHLMTAWKSPINLTQESHERVKRSLLETTPTVKPKRVRTLPPLEAIPDEIVCTEQPDPNHVPKVIFSQVDNLEGLQKAVITLGGVVVTEPTQATHLVMTRLTRTIKLLTCLCCVKCIASSDWLVESARAGKFLPADNYKIVNPDFEKQFKCDITKTVKQPMRNKLFEGKIFYLTPSIFPSVKIIQQLIELCGGVTEKTRRSSVRIQEALKQNPNSYIIISCADDLHLVADLSKLPKSNQIICTTEVVMKSIMTQTINFDDHMYNV